MAANKSSSMCEISFNIAEKTTGEIVPLINAILNTALTVPTIVFNFLVLVVLVRAPAFRTPPFFILIGLALSDMGVGLIANPLAVSINIAILTQNARLFCAARAGFVVASAILSCISLLTTTFASVDRYLAVTLHLRYQEKITKRRVIAALAAVWLVAGIQGPVAALNPNTVYITSLAIGMVSLCIVVTSFAYTRIYKEVKRHATNINEQEMQLASEKQSSLAGCHKMNVCMFLVFCTLVLCYGPFTCLFAIQLALKGWTRKRALAQEFASTLVLANSMLNPLLYCWRLRAIRAEIKKLLRPFSNTCREPISQENTSTAMKVISTSLMQEPTQLQTLVENSRRLEDLEDSTM